jgi:uncharacterized protein
MKNAEIGKVVSGSLADGLLIRIHEHADLDTIKSGKFVIVRTNKSTYFSLITDIQLEVSDTDIIKFPPPEPYSVLHKVLQIKDMFTLVRLKPMIMLNEQKQALPVKTIPHHFSSVTHATQEDVEAVFGSEQKDTRFFNIGTPLDMDAPVCIDLEKLSERSNGIFGKTGTGKTFITRLLLAGLMYQNKTVNLIFDMHSEYGLQARKEGSRHFVKGLKTLFPQSVIICSLDAVSTRRRGTNPDIVLSLSYEDITVEDVLSLQDELNLHPTACEAAHLLSAKYKDQWLHELLKNGDKLKDFAFTVGAHPESLAALYRKLKRLEYLPFLQSQRTKNSVVTEILSYLDRGISVIIEFGNFTSTFIYLLVANIITRRIHAAYIEKTELFLGTQDSAYEPKKLLITIEEAHKFLNPQAAKQTIFGIIAREMRKYYVSLFIIDQRPSSIDQDVLSQIGTKLVAQLTDDKDIAAVMTGVSNATQLKTVLASLDSKQQLLLLGHATPMPIVVQTRPYDELLYHALTKQHFKQEKSIDTLIQQLY